MNDPYEDLNELFDTVFKSFKGHIELELNGDADVDNLHPRKRFFPASQGHATASAESPIIGQPIQTHGKYYFTNTVIRTTNGITTIESTSSGLDPDEQLPDVDTFVPSRPKHLDSTKNLPSQQNEGLLSKLKSFFNVW